MIGLDFKAQSLMNIDGRAYDAFDAKDLALSRPRLLFDITVMLAPKELPGLEMSPGASAAIPPCAP